MNIDRINFKKIDKDFLKNELYNNANNKPTKKIIKDLLRNVDLSISNGDYLVCRNTLMVTLFYEPKETFDFIRKKGLFRYSRYVNKKCIVKPLVCELIEIGKDFGNFPTNAFSYLESIINFATISDSYDLFEQIIIKEFKLFEKIHKDKSIIKTLLSATDYLFLSGYSPESVYNLSELSNRTAEEISSAVSYLIHIYTTRIKSQDIKISLINEKYIRSGEIAKLIIPACYYLDFKEFEIMIDYFKYECKKENNQLYIKPPFEDFEKSIRAGYIRTEIQKLNDKVEENEALSIESLIEVLNKHEKIKFFTKTDSNNYPRYRLEFPELVYDYIIEHFIKPDALFKEEVIYLSGVFKEQLLNPNDLNGIKIKDNLSLYDFIKIRRVFLLFYIMFAKEIFKIEKIDNDLLLRSLIPIYPSELFYQLMEKLFPSDKIESFLDIVCWEPGLDVVFDLQYHSILYLNDHYIIPLSIFSNSNSIRNLFASEYKQSNNSLLNTGENLVTELTNTFKQINIPCFTEISIVITDIDVCAFYEDTLFVFECKQTLHPVSSYDLRTTYDYIKKAEVQLDRINQSFTNGQLLNLLETKLKIRTDKITRLVSSVVLSNRLFNGNVFKYPIRNIHEIKNMLTNGTMRTDNGTYNLWKGKTLTIEFMLDYFSLSNKLTSLLINSLTKRTITYEYAEPKIIFDAYYLDSDFAIPKLKEFTDSLEKAEDS